MKRKIGCLLAAVMLFSNTGIVFADTTAPAEIAAAADTSADFVPYVPDGFFNAAVNDYVEYEEAAPAEETAPADLTENDPAVELYDDDSAMVQVNYETAYGKCVISFKCDYSYNGGTYAQVRNITAASGETSVKGNIVIPQTVTYAGKQITVVSVKKSAFEGCGASKITLPNTVHEIEERAFMNCPNLEEVIISSTYDPSRTNSDGSYIDCTLQKGHVPSVIGKNAFYGCTALKKATIHGFMTIGDSLFEGCTSLKDVDINNDGEYAIANYNKLENVPITTTVGARAFAGCSSLETLNISKGLVGNLNYISFEGCDSLKAINVSSENTRFISVDGVLYTKGQGNIVQSNGTVENMAYPIALIFYPKAKPDTVFNVPSLCTSIQDYAVANNTHIQKLVISTMPIYAYNASLGIVTETDRSFGIGSNAFRESTALQSVTINNPVTVGNYAFYNCDKLETYTKNKNGGWIGERSFSDCDALKVLDLYGYSSLGRYAFADCRSVTKLTCVATGTCNDYAFSGCTALKEADISAMFTDSTQVFRTYVFSGCTALEKVVFSNTLLGISSGTFYDCNSLTEVTNISENMHEIGANAFVNCLALKKAPTARFLTRLNTSSFVNCPKLEDVTLTRSCVMMFPNAFVDCPNVVITAPEGSVPDDYSVKYNIKWKSCKDDIKDTEFLMFDTVKDVVGNDVLRLTGYRGGFLSLTIPEDIYKSFGFSEGLKEPTVMHIGWINRPLLGTCNMRDYLQEIDLGGITEVYDSALAGCGNLKSVTFHEGLTMVAVNAFGNCRSLESVDLPSTLNDKTVKVDTREYFYPAIGSGAFAGCIALKELKFTDAPSTHITFETRAFTGCTSLEEVVLPYTTRDIKDSAFENCTALERVKFSPLTENVNKYAFRNCRSLGTVTIQANMFVDDYAFAGCTSLQRIVIPASANTAPSTYAFSDCDPASTYIVCSAGSKAESYAKDAGYLTEIVEFVENTNYAVIYGKLTFPEEISVTRDGVKLTTKDKVIEGNVLKITTSDKADPYKEYSIFVNGKPLAESGEYTVRENENITITTTSTDTLKWGDADMSGDIDVTDAAMTMQHVLNPAALNLSADVVAKLDVNADNVVDSGDAADIFQKTLISTFPFAAEKQK